MVDQEIWKDILGVNGYQVSNKGRVKNSNGYVLKPCSSYGLYLKVGLMTPHGQKLFTIHRLVAKAFIPNLEGKKEVNHIDGNKHNNNVSNLEWATRQENALHSVRKGLQTKEQLDKAIVSMKKANQKPLLQIKDGVIIKEFPSVREASRQLKMSNGRISECARNGKKYRNYFWRYKYE